MNDPAKDENWEKVSSGHYYGLGKLLNKKVLAVFLDQSKEAMKFKLENDESLFLFLDNSCCSNGWIEHVSGIDRLPFTITEIDEIEIGNVIPTRQSCDCLYGVRFKIDSYSYLFIEFRNSSNGYYGSTIREGTMPAETAWKKLEEDF